MLIFNIIKTIAFLSLSLGALLYAGRNERIAKPSSTSSHNSRSIRSEMHASSEVEQRSKTAREEANKAIDPNAEQGLKETRNALEELQAGNEKAALNAIERAAEKIDILFKHHSAKNTVPVDTEVVTYDLASEDAHAIKDMTKSAKQAVDNLNFPVGRHLLDLLRSEIRIRTFHLPIGSYRAALRESAILIEKQQISEAKFVLRSALKTLVIYDHTIAIPLVKAHVMLADAEDVHAKDKSEALKILDVAQAELERAKLLGYSSGRSEEFAGLKREIENLQKHIKGSRSGITGFFKSIKDKMSSLLKHDAGLKKQKLY